MVPGAVHSTWTDLLARHRVKASTGVACLQVFDPATGVWNETGAKQAQLRESGNLRD